MPIEQIKPDDHFDPEQWERVYTDHAGGDFIFRRGVELAEEISCRVSSPDQLWLDVGCGTGNLVSSLSRKGQTVIGIDHDPAMIEYAKNRFLNEQTADKLKFTTADACHLPFEDETINGITAVSLTGCLTSVNEFFQEIHRVLRQGGFAVMTFTNRTSLLLKINSYLCNIITPTGRLRDKNFSFRLYNDENVIEDFNKAGFTVIEIRYYNFLLNWGDWLLPPAFLAMYMEGLKCPKIRRRLGRNFIILAQKI